MHATPGIIINMIIYQFDFVIIIINSTYIYNLKKKYEHISFR